MKFLDPNKPLTGCSRQTCTDCPIRDEIHCHFNGRDLVHFLLAMFPSFLIGGVALVRTSGWLMLGGWILFILLFFGIIEIRVLCSHCPHYAEPGNHLQCWANYGSPRLWKYQPGPMSMLEQMILIVGLIGIFIFPDFLLLINRHWGILLLHLISIAAAFSYMQGSMCNKCINLTCPLNRTSDQVRTLFSGFHTDKE